MRRFMRSHGWRAIVAAGLMLSLTSATTTAATDKPPSTQAQQARIAGSDIHNDEVDAVLAFLRSHYRDGVQPAQTYSGAAFTAEAAALLVSNGLVPAAALRSVRSDMALTELVIQARDVARNLGATDPAAVQTALAARLAASAGVTSDPTVRAMTWLTAKRAWNDQIAASTGMRDASRAAGGIMRLLDVMATLQLLGSDVQPNDPAFIQDLRTSTPEHIIARQAAASMGLPASFANRYAGNLLSDWSKLQLVGFEGDLSSPAMQADLARYGWDGFFRRQVLATLGLPMDAVIGATGAEILRQATAIDLLGGDSTNLQSYGVLRSMEIGTMTFTQGVDRLNALKTQNRGGSGSSSGTSGASQQPTGAGAGGSKRPNSSSDVPPTTPPSNSSRNSPTTPTTPSSPTTPAPPPAGSSSNSNSSSNASNSGQSSSLPNSGGDSPDFSGQTDHSNTGDGGANVIVRTEKTSDSTFTATVIWVGSDGTQYEGESVEFSDGDGDGTYTAATDSNWGAYSGAMPEDGDHEASRDEEGNTSFTVDQDDSSDDSSTEETQSGSDPDAGCVTQDMYFSQRGLFIGFTSVFLVANARGNMTALLAGDFLRGTGNSTPVPEGASNGWIQPVGNPEIPRWFSGDPAELQPPRPTTLPAAPTAPAANGNQINPSPDTSFGSAPTAIPSRTTVQGPTISGHAPIGSTGSSGSVSSNR